MRKQRLELTWIGKDERPRLEPRILVEEAERSYHAEHRVSDGDLFDNRLIFGDNLLALKALEQEFAGQVKCIYIDPPFNTGEMFEHYDDGIEHSIWLSQMRSRLELIHRLLSKDGTLFVHIDDNELGYLTVLLDEIFSRANRAYLITFKQGSATGHKAINPGCVNTTNYILIYAKSKADWQPKRLFTARERDKRYGQFVENINDPYENWRLVTLNKAFADSLGLSEKDARKLLKEEPYLLDEYVLQNAHSVVQMVRPDYKNVSAETRAYIDMSLANPNKIYKQDRDGLSDFYLLGGQRFLFYSQKLKSIDGKLVAGEPLTTLWDDILSNNLHNEGAVKFPKGKKPEALLKRIFELATNPGDLVLDSFAGSGTTGAVAHKMGRRWIMIELGEHCHTHIIPRLRKVIDGEDQGGISKDVNWKGGGGFRYYRLAPSLLTKDKYGNWVINKDYNPAQLAEAVCKHAGFTYKPSDVHYWQHGQSTEQDFIYVTTQSLTRAQLEILSDEVGPEQSLLVYCAAFEGKESDFSNLTVKKIPKSILRKCEWGKDDYSLKIENLPGAPPPMDGDQMLLLEETAEYKTKPPAKRKPAKKDDLFNDAESGDGNAE